MAKANVLIIEDDKTICNMMSNMVRRLGHDVVCAFTSKEGVKEAHSGIYDIVFLDIRLPDGSGLDILPSIRKTDPSPEVIVITGAGGPDAAELAMENGAWDYIEKPFSKIEIMVPLTRALQYRKEKKAQEPMVALKCEGIVGNSAQMRACLDLLTQAASTDASVLITGETGTGKELFAQAIHANSSRANKNFVVVDCAAIPETLVESMLFGHIKGAFTGADKAQEGLISQADGGTLFLDEVGELPPLVQKAFLRVLQEHRFRPVGGRREIESDFRLVAATNRDLEKMTQRRRFRNDLLFRLRSMTIELPPLRERLEDIKDLVFYYMPKLCERYGTEPKGFSPEFFEAPAAYDWPGNVRELVNVLERVLVSARHDPTLFPKHLPTHVRVRGVRASAGNKAKDKATGSAGSSEILHTLRDYREAGIRELEQQYLERLIPLTGGNIKKASRISGLSRSRMYALLKKYKISGLA
ncbi:MAG: sigma-54-dependent Fis family transcriptional regulator [Desulfobacterales bacterium]|nr:sigma-54-dependent Fis family transcriptional regulator [Desulfobacterales bacterium]